MKISKLRSMFLSMAQPTRTTSGALKRAVWIEGPMQWNRAKFYITRVSTILLWGAGEGKMPMCVEEIQRGYTYNLAVPRFINRGKVLCCFLYKRQQNQAKKLVRNTRFDNVFDALDEENSEKRYNGEGKHNGNEAFRHGEFRLGHVFVAVKVEVLVCLEHFIEDGVLRARIVEDEAVE